MVLQLISETAAEAIVQLSVEARTTGEDAVIESHVHNRQTANSVLQRVPRGAARACTVAQEGQAGQSHFYTSALEKELPTGAVNCW